MKRTWEAGLRIVLGSNLEVKKTALGGVILNLPRRSLGIAMVIFVIQKAPIKTPIHILNSGVKYCEVFVKSHDPLDFTLSYRELKRRNPCGT